MKRIWPLKNKQIEIWILILPPISSEALGKSLTSLGLSFHIYKMEIITPILEDCCEKDISEAQKTERLRTAGPW